MAKYKIMVENLEPDSDWPENESIYCDGFAIIGDHGKGTETAVYDMSIMDLAEAIDGSDILKTAAGLVMVVNSAKDAIKGAT